MTKKEISIKDILWTLWKNIIWILIVAILGGIISFGYTKFFVTPKYRSYVMFCANSNTEQKANIITVGEQNASEQLANTFTKVITVDTVMQAVKAELDEEKNSEKYPGYTREKYSVAALRSMITTSLTDSPVFYVYILTTDSKDAENIGKAIAEVAPVELANIVGSGNCKKAQVSSGALYSPNMERNVIAGVGIGLFLACLFFIIKELTDTTIWTEENISSQFEVPVLGTVPPLNLGTKEKY